MGKDKIKGNKSGGKRNKWGERKTEINPRGKEKGNKSGLARRQISIGHKSEIEA